MNVEQASKTVMQELTELPSLRLKDLYRKPIPSPVKLPQHWQDTSVPIENTHACRRTVLASPLKEVSYASNVIRAGPVVSGQVEAAVRCPTAVLSADSVPLLQRVWRISSAHAVPP